MKIIRVVSRYRSSVYQKSSFKTLFCFNRSCYSTVTSKESESDKHERKGGDIFGRAVHGTFFQEKFKLYNPFSEDYPLQRFLKHNLPKEAYIDISEDLHCFGERLVSEVYRLGLECDQQLPQLTTHDAWGKRVDELKTCSAWKKQKKISAEEGIVAIGYERKYHQFSRLYQMSKLYLYSPAAGLYTCPLAMTDGAAKTIEVFGLQDCKLTEAYKRLTTRNYEKFWTSGQWMTERKGGSDVANGTETTAVFENDIYKLYGYKWFSSATDADIALTLARVVDNDGFVKEGTKGLTLFYVETRDKEGMLNNIQMVKLKNKLGTRQVPTAELLLDGVLAHRIAEEGQGVSGISNMLTLTRIHNACASVAAMRHMIRLSRDYSQRRYAFGKKVSGFPLHMQTLARMEIETRGSLLLMLHVAVLLGRVECHVGTDDDVLLLRLFSPILKLYTAKQAVATISEGLETFGGQGYIEDTGLPVMLRDAQVLPIWEGTTNILSLDVLRSLDKTKGEVLKAFISNVDIRIELARNNERLSECCSLVGRSANNIFEFATTQPELLMISARDFAYSIARTYIGALLLENAVNEYSTNEDIVAAQRWCKHHDLCPLTQGMNMSVYSDVGVINDYNIVMEGYNQK